MLSLFKKILAFQVAVSSSFVLSSKAACGSGSCELDKVKFKYSVLVVDDGADGDWTRSGTISIGSDDEPEGFSHSGNGGLPEVYDFITDKEVEVDPKNFTIEQSFTDAPQLIDLIIEIPCGVKEVKVNGITFTVPKEGENPIEHAFSPSTFHPDYSWYQFFGDLGIITSGNAEQKIKPALTLSRFSRDPRLSGKTYSLAFSYKKEGEDEEEEGGGEESGGGGGGGFPDDRSYRAFWSIPGGDDKGGVDIAWYSPSLSGSTGLSTITFSPTGTEVELVPASGGRKQARLEDNGLVDVVSASGVLTINYFEEGAVGSKDGSGFYTASGTPARALVIDETSGTHVDYAKYENGVAVKEWALNDSTPGTFEKLDVTSGQKSVTIKGTDTNGDAYVTDEVWDTAASPDVLLHRSTRVKRTFDWGKEVIAEIEGVDGFEKTTSYSYYDDELGDGDNYGHLEQTISADGSWERYEYASDGSVNKTVSGYLDGAPGAAENVSRVVTISKSSASGYTTETRITKILNQEVGRKYAVTKDDGTERKDIVCTVVGAASNASTNLVTTTKYASGKVVSVQNPDGTMTIYDSSTSLGVTTTTTWRGEPNSGGTAIVAGTKTIRETDEDGELLSEERRDIASDLLLEGYEIVSRDAKGRVTETEYSDGTTEEKTYGTHGVTWEKNRRGEETTYTYYSNGKTQSVARAGVTTIYGYDGDGNLETVTRKGSDNSEIVTETNTYNASGERTSTEDAEGNVTSYAESAGTGGQRITVTTLPSLATWVETNHRDGKLLSISGTGAHPMSYEYGTTSAGWQFVKKIKVGVSGAETEWTKTYTDMAGRMVKVEYADEAEETTAYNALGQMTSQTDPDGVTRVYSYNGQGQMTHQGIDLNGDGDVDAGDRITKTEQSVVTAHSETVLRTVTSEASESGYVTTGTMDRTYNGRKQWQTQFGLETSSIETLDGTGDATRVTDYSDSSSVTEEYEDGRLVSQQRKLSSTNIGTTTFQYDAHGRLWKSIDGRTSTQTVTTYFDNDLPETVTTGSMATTYAYNANGQPSTVTKPGSRTSTYLYWPTAELKEVGGTSEYPVSYTYDTQGRMKTMVTSSGTTTWNYDGERGWLNGKTDADSKSVSYAYTPAGRLLTRTWARGITTTYGYDSDSGDLTSQTYSDGTPAVTVSYDQRGRPDTIVDAAGSRDLTTNAAGQVTAESITGSTLYSGLTTATSYDSLLRKDGFTAARNSTTLSDVAYAYDGASRLSTVTRGSQSAHYSYLANSSLVENIAFKQSSTTVMTTTKGHDAYNRLESMSMATSAATHSYTASYNSAGQRSQIAQESGQYWSYGYNNRGEVTSGSKKLLGGTDALGYQLGYTFDAIGNRETAVDNGRTATYTANNVNEYTQRTVPGYANVVGQALADTTVTINGSAATRQGTGYHKELAVTNSSAAVYQPVSVSGVRGSYTAEREGHVFVPKTPEVFTYDDDGNLLSDGRWNYTWNGENRLIGMETSFSAAGAGVPRLRLTFFYDYMGRRISKKVENWNGTVYVPHYTMLFVYDGWNLAAELLSSGQKIRSYAWGSDLSGGQAAGGVGGLLFIEQKPEGKVYATGYDLNGNVCRLYDVGSSGSLAATYEYGPFGERLVESGSYAGVNPIRWSSKYQDQETELVYYGYRFYSPKAGRWLNSDPVGEIGGLNLLAFVANSPVDVIDPLGLFGLPVSIPPPAQAADIYGVISSADWAGRLILIHLVFGQGQTLSVSGTEWESYMTADNESTKSFRDTVKKRMEDEADEFLKTGVIGNIEEFDVSFHVDMKKGEASTGYQFLGGSNNKVGDFRVGGKVKIVSECQLDFDVTYNWNDVMNENKEYESDIRKWRLVQFLSLGLAKPYTMKIYWTGTPTYNRDETLSKGWPFKSEDE